MEFFECECMETIGQDIHLTKFRAMDLNGYFPKSIMNKI